MSLIAGNPPPPCEGGRQRLAMARNREAAQAAGWTAQVVKLDADERAERIADYALEA